MICEKCQTIFLFIRPHTEQPDTTQIKAACPACREVQSAPMRIGSLKEAFETVLGELERSVPKVEPPKEET